MEWNLLATEISEFNPIHYTDSEIFMNRLADHSSIFTAEAEAISLALDHIKKTNNRSFLIFSDSLSCLQALLQASPTNPWVVRVLEKYNQLKSKSSANSAQHQITSPSDPDLQEVPLTGSGFECASLRTSRPPGGGV